MIIENIYGFLSSKNIFFDKLYVISFISIPFSWIICKDECIISYVMKKIENPNYILGNVKDISDLFTLNNNSIIELYSNELIKVKMEIITLNDEDNITLLVPIDEYTEFNNIINEVKDNTFCIKYKAYFIDIFDMKIL